MNYFLKIASILLIVSSTQLKAQNNSFNFTITGNSVTYDGQSISVSTTVAKDSNSVEWNQSNNGAVSLTTFNVIDESVDWDQSTSLGTITLNMLYESTPVDFILVGDSTGISLKLIFRISTSENEIYTFPISTISYQ